MLVTGKRLKGKESKKIKTKRTKKLKSTKNKFKNILQYGLIVFVYLYLIV